MRLSGTELGEGPAAVLLHGQPGSSGDWDSVADLLAPRMRVLAPDRPGYGRSGGSAAGFRENAEAVIGMLDEAGGDSAVVVGHSWASGVALTLAIEHPGRVRALVLVSPVAPTIPAGPLDRLLARPLIGAAATRAGFGIAGLGLALGPVRRKARMAVPALPPKQVAATAAAWRGGSVWRSFHAEQRALLAELPGLAPHLGAIAAPTTILHGSRDRVSPPPHGRELARRIPGARLVEAPGAGHMLPQQRPRLVAEQIAAAAD
ncbi:MAG TPA: alpha/beta hydrolase [Solirubrobacterales bacterium]